MQLANVAKKFYLCDSRPADVSATLQRHKKNERHDPLSPAENLDNFQSYGQQAMALTLKRIQTGTPLFAKSLKDKAKERVLYTRPHSIRNIIPYGIALPSGI